MRCDETKYVHQNYTNYLVIPTKYLCAKLHTLLKTPTSKGTTNPRLIYNFKIDQQHHGLYGFHYTLLTMIKSDT
jgi:hypothetical protein